MFWGLVHAQWSISYQEGWVALWTEVPITIFVVKVLHIQFFRHKSLVLFIYYTHVRKRHTELGEEPVSESWKGFSRWKTSYNFGRLVFNMVMMKAGDDSPEVLRSGICGFNSIVCVNYLFLNNFQAVKASAMMSTGWIILEKLSLSFLQEGRVKLWDLQYFSALQGNRVTNEENKKLLKCN